MTTITDVELVRLRRKIGRQGRGFSDPQLDDIWVEAGGNLTRALLICFEELMLDAARFNDYTQNETQEKKQQVFENLKKSVGYLKDKLDGEVAAATTSARTARILGTRVVPPRRVERPYTDPGDDGSNW